MLVTIDYKATKTQCHSHDWRLDFPASGNFKNKFSFMQNWHLKLSFWNPSIVNIFPNHIDSCSKHHLSIHQTSTKIFLNINPLGTSPECFKFLITFIKWLNWILQRIKRFLPSPLLMHPNVHPKVLLVASRDWTRRSCQPAGGGDQHTHVPPLEILFGT